MYQRVSHAAMHEVCAKPGNCWSRRLAVGETVGELALASGGEYSTRVEAASAAVVLRFGKEAFEKLASCGPNGGVLPQLDMGQAL